MSNIDIDVDYIQHNLELAMTLLRIGFLNICKNPHTDEAVIMRVSRTVLETLSENINKQAKAQSLYTNAYAGITPIGTESAQSKQNT